VDVLLLLLLLLLSFSPMTYAWHGGRLASLSQDFTKMIVTKEQYDEHGVNFCVESFKG
jgi:actin-related protein